MISNRIYGIIRFSIVVDERVKTKPWFIARNHGENFYESYKAALFSEERLRQRFYLFEHVTLPSLDAQTSRAFTVFVLVSEDLPAPWMQKLQALAAEREYLELVPIGPVRNAGDPALEKILPRAPRRWSFLPRRLQKSSFITFRLDDDDALFAGYVEQLEKALA